MPQNRIYKFSDIFEAQSFLNGAIFGGNIANGVFGLVGQVLTFIRPAFAVTFTPARGPEPERLRFADIKEQIESKSDAISVHQVGGRLFFLEKTPTDGVALSANDEVAKGLLGFDRAGSVVGRFYKPSTIAGGAPPCYEWGYSVNETTHVLVTWE
ncbi:hypothetical protein LVJ94_34910 [Pendulispora rubella]|uniref:Uncharacterized protein n=1 Tax=Pendulispora rubella TaxID=2741070 RepID=A0ABZ2KTU4_9BACT